MGLTPPSTINMADFTLWSLRRRVRTRSSFASSGVGCLHQIDKIPSVVRLVYQSSTLKKRHPAGLRLPLTNVHQRLRQVGSIQSYDFVWIHYASRIERELHLWAESAEHFIARRNDCWLTLRIASTVSSPTRILSCLSICSRRRVLQ